VVNTATPIKTKASDVLAIGGITFITLGLGELPALDCWVRCIFKKATAAIVNISSINANVAIANIPAYCASKGGINQLTKAAALALAPYGIRVNAVGPGSIDTAMLAGVNADDEKMKMVLSRTPLGRLGNVEDVANAVVFLASDKAGYITGETIYIDGGRLGLNYVC